jgi:hypothetical protein
MKQLAQAVLHSRNKRTEKQTSAYIRHLPEDGIIAQAWDLASAISYGRLRSVGILHAGRRVTFPDRLADGARVIFASIRRDAPARRRMNAGRDRTWDVQRIPDPTVAN